MLDRAHQLAGQGSLIPADRTYIQHLKVYERHTANAGLHKLHGLRHEYAQQRYLELTGWAAPAAGGPTSEALTPEQKAHDREARLIISRELGHEPSRSQPSTSALRAGIPEAARIVRKGLEPAPVVHRFFLEAKSASLCALRVLQRHMVSILMSPRCSTSVSPSRPLRPSCHHGRMFGQNGRRRNRLW